jgi:hypothetical protein
MAGQIRKMIDTLIEKRAKGDETLRNTTKVKFLMKGIDPDKFNLVSPDDPKVIETIRKLAAELSIAL